MNYVVDVLIGWPARVGRHLAWLAPLVARFVCGWEFMISGWGKLSNLPQVTENFVQWGIILPRLFSPLTSGIEFFGGILLMLGLLTRVSAGALGVVMIVAIKAAKWEDVTGAGGFVDSLTTLVGFDEFEYLALFLWLAIAGAGRVSLDRLLMRYARPGSGPE